MLFFFDKSGAKTNHDSAYVHFPALDAERIFLLWILIGSLAFIVIVVNAQARIALAGWNMLGKSRYFRLPVKM